MCKRGNGSIFKECGEIIRSHNRGKGMSNKAMRDIIKHYGGCMNNHQPLDKKPQTVL